MPRFLNRLRITEASGHWLVFEISARRMRAGSSLLPAPMLDATRRPRSTLVTTSATLQFSESMQSIT